MSLTNKQNGAGAFCSVAIMIAVTCPAICIDMKCLLFSPFLSIPWLVFHLSRLPVAAEEKIDVIEPKRDHSRRNGAFSKEDALKNDGK